MGKKILQCAQATRSWLASWLSCAVWILGFGWDFSWDCCFSWGVLVELIELERRRLILARSDRVSQIMASSSKSAAISLSIARVPYIHRFWHYSGKGLFLVLAFC